MPLSLAGLSLACGQPRHRVSYVDGYCKNVNTDCIMYTRISKLKKEGKALRLIYHVPVAQQDRAAAF